MARQPFPPIFPKTIWKHRKSRNIRQGNGWSQRYCRRLEDVLSLPYSAIIKCTLLFGSNPICAPPSFSLLILTIYRPPPSNIARGTNGGDNMASRMRNRWNAKWVERGSLALLGSQSEIWEIICAFRICLHQACLITTSTWNHRTFSQILLPWKEISNQSAPYNSGISLCATCPLLFLNVLKQRKKFFALPCCLPISIEP